MVVFYILVAFGIFAVILGLLGLVTAKCYNKCCSCCVSKEDLTDFCLMNLFHSMVSGFSWLLYYSEPSQVLHSSLEVSFIKNIDY